MRQRDYATDDDLRAMQDLVQRIWTKDANWHIGDLAWQRNAAPGKEGSWRTQLWEEDGEVVAWGWIELPDTLNLTVDPARPELAEAIIAWFERVGDGERLNCGVLETETHLASALERAGYAPDMEPPYFTHHHMSLDALASPVAPRWVYPAPCSYGRGRAPRRSPSCELVGLRAIKHDHRTSSRGDGRMAVSPGP